MFYYFTKKNINMHYPTLIHKLNSLRAERAFVTVDYLQKKTTALFSFFEKSGINAVVIGLSGGVDSALVAALMTHVAALPSSSLQRVSAVIAPIFGAGTSQQAEATTRALAQCGLLLAQSARFEFQVCDLSESYRALLAAHPFREANAWAEGQMASVLRTPLFYYQVAILQQQGYRSLLLGTTNRDEGAYIGFFGKASDAMVDLQPIADLHKSEVLHVAKYLNVLPEILQATPRGDVWDDRNDEQMIGASYWFLELYQLLLCSGEETTFEANLPADEQLFYGQCKANIETLHRMNNHKYQVGNPAHFLDVMDRKVPKGWV